MSAPAPATPMSVESSRGTTRQAVDHLAGDGRRVRLTGGLPVFCEDRHTGGITSVGSERSMNPAPSKCRVRQRSWFKRLIREQRPTHLFCLNLELSWRSLGQFLWYFSAENGTLAFAREGGICGEVREHGSNIRVRAGKFQEKLGRRVPLTRQLHHDVFRFRFFGFRRFPVYNCTSCLRVHCFFLVSIEILDFGICS